MNNHVGVHKIKKTPSLTAVKFKKQMYDHSVTIDDYYAIIGADLRITCNMESNEIVPDLKVIKRHFPFFVMS